LHGDACVRRLFQPAFTAATSAFIEAFASPKNIGV
jgi:hypothetical protein